MTKNNVDPGLLELDDEALIEDWVISTASSGYAAPGGSGVDGNPNRAVVAVAVPRAGLNSQGRARPVRRVQLGGFGGNCGEEGQIVRAAKRD
jgi:hypothetical protein